jgi:hypothetical protein
MDNTVTIKGSSKMTGVEVVPEWECTANELDEHLKWIMDNEKIADEVLNILSETFIKPSDIKDDFDIDRAETELYFLTKDENEVKILNVLLDHLICSASTVESVKRILADPNSAYIFSRAIFYIDSLIMDGFCEIDDYDLNVLSNSIFQLSRGDVCMYYGGVTEKEKIMKSVIISTAIGFIGKFKFDNKSKEYQLRYAGEILYLTKYLFEEDPRYFSLIAALISKIRFGDEEEGDVTRNALRGLLDIADTARSK